MLRKVILTIALFIGMGLVLQAQPSSPQITNSAQASARFQCFPPGAFSGGACDADGEGAQDDFCGQDDTTDCGGAGCPMIVFDACGDADGSAPTPFPPTPTPPSGDAGAPTDDGDVPQDDSGAPPVDGVDDAVPSMIVVEFYDSCVVAPSVESNVVVRERPTLNEQNFAGTLFYNEVSDVLGIYQTENGDWYLTDQGWVSSSVTQISNVCNDAGFALLVDENGNLVSALGVSVKNPLQDVEAALSGCPSLAANVRALPVIYQFAVLALSNPCQDGNSVVSNIARAGNPPQPAVPPPLPTCIPNTPSVEQYARAENTALNEGDVENCIPTEPPTTLRGQIQRCYGAFDVPNQQLDISERQIDALLEPDFTNYASLQCSFIRTVTMLGEFDDGAEDGSERNLYDRLVVCESFSRADAAVGLLYALIKNADVAALAASDELCGDSIVDLGVVEMPLIDDDSSSACEQTVHETIRLNRLTPSQKFTMLSMVNILPIYSIDENFGFCESNQDWIAELDRIQLFNGIEEPTIESIVESFKIGLWLDDERFITESNLQNELLVGTGVYQAQLDGRSAIFLIKADGTTQQIDVDFAGNQFYPTMRTDNRAVAFLREDQGDDGIAYTLTINVLNNEIVPFQDVDINGLLSEAGLEAEGYTLAKSRLAWHPSGELLLFTMIDSQDEEQIFAVSVDDTGFAENLRPLPSGSSANFAPNGTYYVQVSNDDILTVVPWNTAEDSETYEIGAPYPVLEEASQNDVDCVAPIVSASSYAVFTACTRPVPDTDDVERSLLRIDADNSENVGVTELLRDTDIEISSLSLLGGTPYFTFIDESGALYLYYPSEITETEAEGDQEWVIQEVDEPSFTNGLPLEHLEWVQGDE